MHLAPKAVRCLLLYKIIKGFPLLVKGNMILPYSNTFNMNIIKSILIISLTLSFLPNIQGQNTEAYSWNHVPIGGGGYITGMKIHPLNGDRRYYRTDVGGAYRWDPNSNRMEQMIFLENKNLYSVAGIALHPTDENIVYLSVGRNCDPEQNEILVSTDAGENFDIVDIVGGVPFWFAANGGRDCGGNSDKDRQGTPLAINPHNTNELYIGTRSKGLYILNLTSLQLTDVPNSSIPENNNFQSIRSVVFHPTQNLVYIAYIGHGVYVGNTLTQVYTNYGENSNTELQDAIDISISKDANYMLVACKTQGIMKATNLTGALNWDLLSGYNSADSEGYLTVDCSPHQNNVAVTVVAAWNHINEFQVTTDAGSSWNQIDGSVAEEDNHFKWRSDSFASHVSQIAFDPTQSSKMHYTSWFSTFSCDNFSLSGPNSWHNDYSKGHEEIVTTDLVAFPTNSEGEFLMAGSGDHSGFLFDADITNQDSFATFTISDRVTTDINPLKKNASLDFCEKQTDHLIACITEEWGTSNAGLVSSDDGGITWDLVTGFGTDSYNKSIVAMSSDNPNNIIALNNDHMIYTLNGNDFFDATGTTNNNPSCTIPYSINCLAPTDFSGTNINDNVFAGFRNITADRNYDCVFYYYDWDGNFSITTDGGANWCIINNTSLPSSSSIWDKARLISIPGIANAGHLWININKELWHSTNSGKNWVNYTSSHSVDEVLALSFGKGLNTNYEALYIFGSIDGVAGNFFYRSDDAGLSWTKINDINEQENWGDPKIIAGDRNIAGRLYASVSGQGVIFGDSEENVLCDNTEITTDGEFDDINSNSIPSWTVSEINNATMSGTINNWTKAVLDISIPGANNYDLQLWQDDLTMDEDKLYLILLDLRADDERPATIKLRNKTDGTSYLERDIELHSTAHEYAYLFKPPVSDDDLRLTLMVGGDDKTVYVDHIRFREFCEGDISEIDCVELITLDDHEIDPSIYQAKNEIHSNGTILNGGDVTFRAGSLISIEAGFEINANATFLAEIVGCP